MVLTRPTGEDRLMLTASFRLTNAGKIIFTIFTALKKNKPLVFQVITVLSGLVKKKVVNK
jgi:hypothetical protein